MGLPVIRAARLEEVERLLAIEAAAGRLFDSMELPAELPGLAPDEVRAAIAAGTAFVATDHADRPVAFALCAAHAEGFHLRELDVHPDHMRRGLGGRLLEHVCERARHERVASERRVVTLTTFRDVPWNAPYYTRRGFVVLEAAAQPAWLAALRAEEDGGPLGRWPRVAMARYL